MNAELHTGSEQTQVRIHAEGKKESRSMNRRGQTDSRCCVSGRYGFCPPQHFYTLRYPPPSTGKVISMLFFFYSLPHPHLNAASHLCLFFSTFLFHSTLLLFEVSYAPGGKVHSAAKQSCRQLALFKASVTHRLIKQTL